MFTRQYDVTLISDVSITADASTAGGHTSLDYLPGSVFLGCAAAKSVRRGEGFDEDFFLSGRVRFTDARPLIDGEKSFPVPLCFSGGKNEEWAGRPPYNLLLNARTEKKSQQWKKDYISFDGKAFKLLKVAMNTNIKTAVDRTKRRAMDEHLFDCESISAGSLYRMEVQADCEVDLVRAEELLLKSGPIRFGRSRSAEYGKVIINAVQSDARNSQGSEISANGKYIHILLLSDLALWRDGHPVLMPKGEDFGLTNARIALDKTFMRSKTMSPWNSYYNSRMDERQLLSRGSVITFELESEADRETLLQIQESLSAGVGLFREEGFGQVLINPKWLLESSSYNLDEAEKGNSDKQSPEEPKTALIQYLMRKRKNQQDSYTAYEIGVQWAKSWSKYYSNGETVAPMKSQWGSIREIAMQSMNVEGVLLSKLEGFCQDGLRRKEWNSQVGSGRSSSLYEELRGAIVKQSESESNRFVCLALCYASSEIRKIIAGNNRGRDR